MKINIRTNYKVLENNADSVNGNIYTWVFNKDSNKSIDMLIDTSNSNNSFVVIETLNNVFPIVCIVIVVFVVFLLLLLKNKKNNKI